MCRPSVLATRHGHRGDTPLDVGQPRGKVRAEQQARGLVGHRDPEVGVDDQDALAHRLDDGAELRGLSSLVAGDPGETRLDVDALADVARGQDHRPRPVAQRHLLEDHVGGELASVGPGQHLGVGHRRGRRVAEVGEPGAEDPLRHGGLQLEHARPDEPGRPGAQQVGPAPVDIGQAERAGVEHVDGVGADVDGGLEPGDRGKQARALRGGGDPAGEILDQRLVVGPESARVGGTEHDRALRVAAGRGDRHGQQLDRAQLGQRRRGRLGHRRRLVAQREDRRAVARAGRHEPAAEAARRGTDQALDGLAHLRCRADLELRRVPVEQLDRAPVRQGRHDQAGQRRDPRADVGPGAQHIARPDEQGEPSLAALEGLA